MLVGSIFLFSNSNRDLGLNQKDQQDVPGIVIAVGSAVLLIGQLWKTRVVFQMSELVHYSLKLTCIFFEAMGTLFFMLGGIYTTDFYLISDEGALDQYDRNRLRATFFEVAGGFYMYHSFLYMLLVAYLYY